MEQTVTARMALVRKIAEAARALWVVSVPPHYDSPSLDRHIERLRECLQGVRPLILQACTLSVGASETVRQRILWLLDMGTQLADGLDRNYDRIPWDRALWLCRQAAQEIRECFGLRFER